MTSIKNALISVFSKEGLEPLVKAMHARGINLFSTGGTYDYIKKAGVPVQSVESVTGYPGILGGRVKTLHPGIFGGILYRRAVKEDVEQTARYNIPSFDLVLVDLYPFSETVRSGAGHQDIIEKIDIGGVSLIRAAAKNYKDVLIIPSRAEYPVLNSILQGDLEADEALRRKMAFKAFALTAAYDQAISGYLGGEPVRPGFTQGKNLRYGENPHQQGTFYGNLEELFEQLNGKELSYNNLLDVDAAVSLIDEFEEPAAAILKHNNPCGLATGDTLAVAWKKALEGDPVSAFGGVIVVNREMDDETAAEINKIFCEVVIAPGYSAGALESLRQKKNRIILGRRSTELPAVTFRSLLNGILEQQRDTYTESEDDLRTVTTLTPTPEQVQDLLFANRIVKHARSNAIVLAGGMQLMGTGAGQTSRVDALKQAVEKAKSFNFDLEDAVMASDAFFPFPDCVEIAGKAGIKAIIQPGGSVKDQDSIDACNRLGITMVFTGHRHFRH